MADPTYALRDQGRQALQAGNLDAAVDLLSRAVMASDADTDAKMLLGIAYSMKGLHAQAKRALEGAVAGAPQNPDYRFNLGMVLEKAGDTQGAAQAFRATLQINPQHPQARAKLQALGPQAGYAPLAAPAAPTAAPPPAAPPSPSGPFAPPPSSTYGAPPTWGPPPGSPAAPPQPQAPPVYGQPPAGGGLPGLPPPPIGGAPLGSLPPIGQPPMSGAPLGGLPPIGQPPMGQPGMTPPPPIGAAPLGGPPPMGAPIGGPPMGAIPGMVAPQAPEGMVQCPRCGQFTRAGMLCEMCSTPLPPPPRHTAPAGPAAFGTIGPAPGYVAAPPADNFDIREGFAQWLPILTGPKAFFMDQVGREGFKEPGAFIMSWCVAHYAVSFLTNLVHRASGSNIGGFACGWICTWLMVMGILHVWAGLLHGLSRLFGGQGSYAGTFRVAAFGAAPLLLCATIGMLTANLMMPDPDKLQNSSRPAPPNRALASVTMPIEADAPFALAQINTPGAPGSPSFGSPRRYPYGGPGSGTPSSDSRARLRRLGKLFDELKNACMPALFIIGFGYLWSIVVLILGISEVHSVGTGPAVGVVLISAVIIAAILGAIGTFLAATIATVFQQVMSGATGGRPYR